MQFTPYVPIVPPYTQEWRNFIPKEATPLSQASASEMRALRNTLLLWGGLGIVAGAAATGLVTALSFRSYRESKNKSIIKPALWTAGGSIVIGGTLLLLIYKSLTKPSENAAALAIGAKLAT